MKNRFLDKFRRGEPSVGTFFEMGGPAVGEMIALTDLDYFVIDGENGPYDVLQAADIIRAAEGAGTGVRMGAAGMAPAMGIAFASWDGIEGFEVNKAMLPTLP